MLCSKILVACDGSTLGQKALGKAIELASLDQSIKIEVIYVVTIPNQPHAVLDNIPEIEEVLYREGKEVIEQANLALSKLPNFSQTYLLNGSPSSVILNHAQEYKCDLIIMGSRGLSGIKEFLGSVSHKVVQWSPIPVLIIK
ncbi:MAG: universal stress protein [Veillonellales bacterium]